jgi:hypothetical protein
LREEKRKEERLKMLVCFDGLSVCLWLVSQAHGAEDMIPRPNPSDGQTDQAQNEGYTTY